MTVWSAADWIELSKRKTEDRRWTQKVWGWTPVFRFTHPELEPGPAMRRQARLIDRQHAAAERRSNHEDTKSPVADWKPVRTSVCVVCGTLCVERPGESRCRRHRDSWKCGKCGEIKPTNDFHRQAGSKRGHSTRCKTCKNSEPVARENRLRTRYKRACQDAGVEPVIERWTVDQLTERWGDRCYYCGDEWTDVDHYVPVAEGGSHSLRNCRPACATCNNAKRASMPTAWAASVVMVELKRRGIDLPPGVLESLRSLAA